MSARRLWIAAEDGLPIVRQCALAGVTRSTVYAHPEPVQPIELELLKLIDEEYTCHPFYGSRRMVQFLKNKGYTVNRKHVQRLMQTLGLSGMAPGPNTSQPHPEHAIYPYLLRGISYVPIRCGALTSPTFV